MTPRWSLVPAALAAMIFFVKDPIRAGGPDAGVSSAKEVLAWAEGVLKKSRSHAADGVMLDESGNVRSSDVRLVALDRVGRQLRGDNPAALGQWSLEIVGSLTDSDERVIAARNLAWSGHRAEAAKIVREILTTEAGREAPSRFAVVQAMDGVVYLGDASLLPEIEALLENAEFEVVAAQTLDRLADAAPSAVMTSLNRHPTWLRDRPMLRADCFAKADFSDVPQRAEFERYLLREDVPVSAKEKAILGLAQRGHILMVGLFTGPPDAGFPEQNRSGTAKALSEWLSRDDLQTLHSAVCECLEWLDAN